MRKAVSCSPSQACAPSRLTARLTLYWILSALLVASRKARTLSQHSNLSICYIKSTRQLFIEWKKQIKMGKRSKTRLQWGKLDSQRPSNTKILWLEKSHKMHTGHPLNALYHGDTGPHTKAAAHSPPWARKRRYTGNKWTLYLKRAMQNLNH